MPLPLVLLTFSTLAFLIIERIFPGRSLPQSRGWYVRALMFNGIQAILAFSVGKLWFYYNYSSIFNISLWQHPVAEGLTAWFIGTFIFYWWHRARHLPYLWEMFHQIHHSPTRIEVLTSFYKHPLEIFVGSLIINTLTYSILGASIEGALWYTFFAAFGEYCYHANIKTPAFMRYFIQTPELHSIHHARNIHRYNFSDIPLWDRLFGTYRDTTTFMPEAGFKNEQERAIKAMLIGINIEKL